MSAARILQLSPRLANQIAAGEVVERPASVVKELLENSLDAGATRIEIEIERGGIQLIRLSDNGDGIHPDDLPLALARHATSKISTLDDLAGVLSLGFRGEALASIASVAKLLLVSRRRDEANAWQAFAEGAGMQVQVQPAALTEGTRIEVRDLFFNTPARRRFLRSEATEFAHIDDTVRRVALARPDVAITLKHNGRGVRQLRAGRDQAAQAARVAAVLGRSFLLTSAAIDAQIDSVQLAGFVGHPSQHRAQADGQYVFVNGRAIRDRVVSHAIRAGFADTIPAGRSPSYVLFLQLPATEVDVNVHPTKHEVRFRNARWLHDWLTRTVAEAVARSADQINTETGEVTLAPVSALPTLAVHEARSAYASPAPSVSADAVRQRAVAEHQTPMSRFSADRFADVDSALPLQRVAAEVVLQWSTPVRVWRAPAVLAAYLQAHWLAGVNPAVLPLLLPVSLSLPMPLTERVERRLQALGFGLQLVQRQTPPQQTLQLQTLQLQTAPALLRGADWPCLLESLAAVLLAALPATPVAQWPADTDTKLAKIAAAHLLQQEVSQSSGFWQPIIAWAARSAPEHGKSPTEQDWSTLWPN